MFKAVCLFKLKQGIDEKTFEEFFKKHVDEAKKLKNLQNYTVAKIINNEDSKIFYRVNELYYNSLSELEDSFSTELAKDATDDLLKWVDDFKCIIVDESIVL